MNNKSLFVDRSGVIRPDLIPLAAFLCAEEYGTYARSIILDHAAAGAPLEVLTRPTPDGWVVLEPSDLAAAEEVLRRGGPAPRVESGAGNRCSVVQKKNGRPASTDHRPPAADHREAQPSSNGAAPPPAGPADANGRPTTLAELVDHEALGYRAWGTPEGDFLARQMDRLAQLVRWTGATSPEEHDDRMETWDEQLREEWERRGYDAGRREGRRLAFDEVLLVLKRS